MTENIIRASRGALVLSVAALTLSACGGGGSSGGGGNPNPTPTPGGPQVYLTDVSGNNSLTTPDTILAFPISALSGTSVTPSQQINSGSMTSAFGIAADAGGDTFIADQASATIVEFSAGASGASVSPARTINSSALSSPYGIALDAQGNIYVADPTGGDGNGAIDEFSSSQSGSVAPVRQITGSGTGLSQPYGIAVDINGNIYVANDAGAPSNPHNPSVEVFNASSSTPTRTITGSSTQLNVPVAIAVDNQGNIYVANENGNSVTVFSSAQNGNVAPVRAIAGPATVIAGPVGVALDSSSNLYVTNLQASGVPGSLNVFGPNANGNVAPSIIVGGPATASNFNPVGVAI